MRYLLKIKYDGSKFSGFQRLKNLPTVQKEIEDALFKIDQEDIKIKGAGRTDRGVHAYCQMAHFDTDKKLPKLNLKEAINSLVSNYLYIAEVTEISDEIHARFSVERKVYQYKINLGEYDPLKEDYYWQLNYKLDLKAMREASKLFLGIHDFENFVSGPRDSYEAIIYDITLNKDKDILTLTFEGKSFYRYMVRNLVGALVDVGKGKVTMQEIKDSLAKKTNQKFSVAKASGLYLMDIEY